MNDPENHYLNCKLQKIDFLYFSFEILFWIFMKKILWKQLREKMFSICHLNIGSLCKNIDKLKEFLDSLNDTFRIVVVTEAWCYKTANKNSLLEMPNYLVLHKTRKNWKGSDICIYVHKSLKFNIRDNNDILNTGNTVYWSSQWKITK